MTARRTEGGNPDRARDRRTAGHHSQVGL
jgi:hypothetical protein